MASFEDFTATPTLAPAKGEPIQFNDWIDSLEQAESSGGKNLFNSRTGATGPLQITPIAAADVGADYARAVEDHAYARGVGVQYAKKLWKQFNGDPELTAAAYHTGPTQISKWIKEAQANGVDPNSYVISKLGPEGQGHNQRVMSRFRKTVEEGDTVADTKPASFEDFATSAKPKDTGTGNKDIPPALDKETAVATFKNVVQSAKDLGGTIAVVADMILGFPAFVASETFGLGSAAGAALKGADRKTAWQAGRAGSEWLLPEWTKSPFGSLLNQIGSGEIYKESPGGKVMEGLTEKLKAAGEWVEKKTNGSVPAEAVETLINQAMIGAGPLAGRAVRGVFKKTPEVPIAPSFDDFIPGPKTRQQMRGEIGERFADTADATELEKGIGGKYRLPEENARLRKKAEMLTMGMAVGAGVGGAVLYNQLRSPGNDVIQDEKGEPQPNSDGTFYAENNEDFLKLAPLLLAAGWVKQKGGMWHTEAVTRLASPLKDTMIRGADVAADHSAAIAKVKANLGERYGTLGNEDGLINAEYAKTPSGQADAWSDRAIRNYLNKYAGTKEDPLRDVEIPFTNLDNIRWEDAWDRLIKGKQVEGPKGPETQWDVKSMNRPEVNLDRTHNLESLRTSGAIKSYLSHVGDYLRQNVPPEKLQQYDLTRAVKETAANDARVAKEMEKAASASMKDLPVYKEYPNGFKWVELKLPEKLSGDQIKSVRKVKDLRDLAREEASHQHFGGDIEAIHQRYVKQGGVYEAVGADGKVIVNTYTGEPARGATPEEAHLAGQLAQEGNQMGHCVGGYCEGVASGESRIFSLRDAKGRSHVTIETNPADVRRFGPDFYYQEMSSPEFKAKYPQPEDYYSRVGTAHLESGRKWRKAVMKSEEFRKALAESPENILQIKGKQNRAPNAEYLPYVQDFVKSGKWGEVGDLENTGLIRADRRPDGTQFGPGEGELLRQKFGDSKYITREDFEKAHNEWREARGVGPRNQQGFMDPRLAKALTIAGVGALAGAALFPDDRLTAGLVGGFIALGLGSGKVSELPRLLGDNKLTRSVERGIKASVEQFQRNVNPDLLGKDAESAASVLGRVYTEMMQKQLAIEIPSGKRTEFWLREGGSKSKMFLKALEKGSTFPDPVMNSYAIAYRTWMNKIYKQDQAMGIKYDPIDNYVYHAFEDPKGAAAFFEKKYGAKFGDPNFTKDRMFEFIEEAEKAGFKLKTENPEALMVMRQHASDIAQMKVQALRDLESFGLARRVTKGNPVGQGEALWRSPNGELYALKDQPNQIMHNAFNTKSLWADPGIVGQGFRALAYLKNAIVPISLFGLFHPLHVQLGMSFADPMVAITKKYAANKATFFDVVKEALSKATLIDAVSTPMEGWRILEAFRGKTPYNKLSIADQYALTLMQEGTFNPTMPIEYRNTHMKNWREAIAAVTAGDLFKAATGATIGATAAGLASTGVALPIAAGLIGSKLFSSVGHTAVWELPWAILEKFYTKPIFEQWIPAVKTAAYLRQAYAALEANPALLNSPLERMNELRKQSKMIDDRFGEVQYKTLFMNRAIKDVGVAAFLSYGWQLGFVRSYVGSAPEMSSAIRGLMRGEKLAEKVAKGDLDKSLFVGNYITSTLLYGGLLTYALTGQAPRDIMDYIFPRTGEKNADGTDARVGTPFYTREFVSIPKHMQEEGLLRGLGITIGNKLSPAVGMLKAMVTNRDFFNKEISDPNADAFTQLGQKLAYAFKSLEPISSTSYDKGPPGAKTAILSATGFSPAPKYVTQTPIEAKISHTFRTYNPSVTPYDKAAYGQEVSELYKLRQRGDADKFNEGMEKLQEKYGLNSNQMRLIEKNSQIPGPERMFRRLDVKQQERLLNEMSPEEQKRFRPYAKKALRY